MALRRLARPHLLLGRRDAELPAELCVSTHSGTQHGPGSGTPAPPGNGQLVGNPADYRPLVRALLTALDAWVRNGREPPPSVYPRLADGTAANWRQTDSGWNPLPGVRYPEVIQQPEWSIAGPSFSRIVARRSSRR